MSERLSFRERLERRENTVARNPAPSGSLANVVLRLDGEVDKPVTVIQTLAHWGLGLRQAHGVVTRLVAGQALPVRLPNAPDPKEIVSCLKGLRIAVSFPHPPARVDVKAIRNSLGLTQGEFAARFCFEVNSVRNWEQERYPPDPSTRILLKIIEHYPDTVENVLTVP